MNTSIKFVTSLLTVATIVTSCGTENEQHSSASGFGISKILQKPKDQLKEANDRILASIQAQVARGQRTFSIDGRQVTVSFDVSSFSEAHQNKILGALDILTQNFNSYHTASADPLTQCAEKRATKDFLPWGGYVSERATTFASQVSWAMTLPKYNLLWHADNNVPVKFIAFSEPRRADGTIVGGRAYVRSDRPKVKADSAEEAALTIELNAIALDVQQFGAGSFADTIYHEWLHRVGYTHPTGYPGSFMKELSQCLGFGNQSFGFTGDFFGAGEPTLVAD